MHPLANRVVAETQLPAAVGAGVQVLQVAIHDVQLWGRRSRRRARWKLSQAKDLH